MAGAGYKLFNTGDVLTAAQVNTYLMEQTVMVFANAAARTTALSGVVSEGMISYLKDTNAVEVYDGSNWVSSDDPNAIQNTIVDAKGDLITATAADTPARLAVGSNGDTLVADSAATVGLRYQGNYAAGKNRIINGDFNINQRAFSSTTTSGTYGFDRFVLVASDGTTTYSAQTFTPGSAPVAGYESTNFARLVSTGQTATTALSCLQQSIEDVRTFAGQTITVSFWAKASSGTPNIVVWFQQQFGSGGSAGVDTGSTKQAISTSWARYSFTIAIPSVSGKTIGSGSALAMRLVTSAGTNRSAYTDSIGIQSATIDIWGVQAEAGNVATAFQTATGTLQGELALAQRYYQKSYNTDTAVPTNATGPGLNYAISPNVANLAYLAQVPLRVAMRAAPTVTIYSYTTSQTGRVSDGGGTDLAASSGNPQVIGTNSFAVQNNSGGTINAASGGFAFHWSASAEL